MIRTKLFCNIQKGGVRWGGHVDIDIFSITTISLRSWRGLTVLLCWGAGLFLLGPVTVTAVLDRAVQYHTGTEPRYSEPSQNIILNITALVPGDTNQSRQIEEEEAVTEYECLYLKRVNVKKNWIMRYDKSLCKVGRRSCE